MVVLKKCLQLICTGFVALICLGGITLLSAFPIDTQPFVEKKYSGWNGVLQAWICTRWNPDGGFIRWLNSCASEFEKTHDGIYLEFTPVQEETLRSINSSGICMPDLIFFSPGVITNRDTLSDFVCDLTLRDDLKSYGDNKAIPVAMGGYIWAYNTALSECIPCTPVMLSSAVLSDTTPAAVLIGLLSGASDEVSEKSTFPDSGIDLGLTTSAVNKTLYSADAFDDFIDGELPYIPVDAKKLARLNRLRENGKGPAWNTSASGAITCTDQLLLAAIPIQDEHHEQTALAEEFVSLLLTENTQDALADIGAFSVIGRRIYSDFSVYSEMDAMLNHLPLWLPDCFSEYSFANSESIVRRFLNGEIPAKNALSLLGFEEV